ncbi:unnamed protein product, partial [Discosporangium mesarthrocarpum]
MLCTVCLEDMPLWQDAFMCQTLDCGHRFHSPCIAEWLTRQTLCPLCKEPVSGFNGNPDFWRWWEAAHSISASSITRHFHKGIQRLLRTSNEEEDH